MEPRFEDLIQSKQFTFYVGEEEKPVVVHAAVISATGQYFDALINGGMKESKEESARLPDVQFDDFLRFCEYAYRGDYTEPSSSNDGTGHKDFSSILLAHACLYCFANTRLIELLRVLAFEKLDKNLCLNDEVFDCRHITSSYINRYLGLARYVYSDASNLPERGGADGKAAELRYRVVENIVDNLEEVDETDEFFNLTEEGGEFVWDFWTAVKVKYPW